VRRFLFLLATLLFADGGTVLFHQQTSEFDITVFSKSEAVRAGANDLSVMVQNRRDNSTVMNATVLLHLKKTQSSGEIMRLTSIATHGKATNKLLYAASVSIPATGTWQLDADVSSDGRNGIASGQLQVLPPQPPMENYWPYVDMVPLLGIAFIINRKLRARFSSRTRA